MRHEQRDILAALPQSRDRDMDDGDPEVKVLPKDALGDRLPEVSVGGRDDADVDPLRLASPDHHELPGLDHPQQLGLQVGSQLGDLVDEDRARVSLREDALSARDGAGERALDVSEEMTLDQPFGDRRAVEGDEGMIAAWAGE